MKINVIEEDKFEIVWKFLKNLDLKKLKEEHEYDSKTHTREPNVHSMRVGSTPSLDKNPTESQLIKWKWASEDSLEDEDCPNVVLESIEKSVMKH